MAICINCYDKPAPVHLPDIASPQENPRLPGGGFLLLHTHKLLEPENETRYNSAVLMGRKLNVRHKRLLGYSGWVAHRC